MRLGKAAPRVDHRTLKLADYILEDKLGIPPLSAGWAGSVQGWPMLLNDSEGDCTAASWLHMRQVWAAGRGRAYVPTDAEAQALYDATRVPEGGAVELDVLNYLRAQKQITAYAAIHPTNSDHVKWGIQLFGGVYAGFALPLAWQGASAWDCQLPVADQGWQWAPNSWGGHAVPIVAYDQDGVEVITWGKRVRVSWQAVAGYMDEAYALLSPDWTDTLSGVDLQTLQNDLSEVTS